MAARIQARAIRRCGELLKEFEPAKNQYDAQADDGPSRTQAAQEAGLSKRQEKTAVRVANVPEEEFEAQVESENPPTVTALAEQDTQKKPPDPLPTAAKPEGLSRFPILRLTTLAGEWSDRIGPLSGPCSFCVNAHRDSMPHVANHVRMCAVPGNGGSHSESTSTFETCGIQARYSRSMALVVLVRVILPYSIQTHLPSRAFYSQFPSPA